MNITNILRKPQNWKIACNYQQKHMDKESCLDQHDHCLELGLPKPRLRCCYHYEATATKCVKDKNRRKDQGDQSVLLTDKFNYLKELPVLTDGTCINQSSELIVQ